MIPVPLSSLPTISHYQKEFERSTRYWHCRDYSVPALRHFDPSTDDGRRRRQRRHFQTTKLVGDQTAKTSVSSVVVTRFERVSANKERRSWRGSWRGRAVTRASRPNERSNHGGQQGYAPCTQRRRNGKGLVAGNGSGCIDGQECLGDKLEKVTGFFREFELFKVIVVEETFKTKQNALSVSVVVSTM